MNYSIFAPTEIISGVGCVSSFRKFSNYGSKCAIITGKNMYKHNSALNDAILALEKENIEYLVITEAENNPSVKSVFDFASRINAFNADFIIGIGGGSSMDTAKAVAIVAKNTDLTEETVFSVSSDAPALPIILIGTTAGTGSEVMPSAVLTIPGDIPIKKSVKTKTSYAKVALCDYTYTASMPDHITVSTALDSICHAIEAIYSKRGGEWSKIYGHAALRKVMPALLRFTENKEDNSQIRDDLYFGSILAGLAINDGGTSFPHSMGYMLTTMHDTSHGYACAVFIGQFLERVSEICDISETLSACGMSSVDEFANKISKIISCYYQRPLLEDEQAKSYSDLAMKMNVNNNYLNLSHEDCVEIYLKMSKGA